MADRNTDSRDRHSRRHRERHSPQEDSRLSYNEIRDRAKREQFSRRHRSDKRDSDDRPNRHREHRDNYDDRRDRRRDRSDVRSDEFKRPKDESRNVKSEEFWSKEPKPTKSDEKVVDKQKPNFETTGKLLEDTNVVNGVVIKYSEPLEAQRPKRKWRLYPFKGEESLEFIPIHRQSAYLLGRDRKVADIPIDHPSCSKQHAVIQFRLVEYERDDQTAGKRIRPYLIDLESSNGSYVNNQRIESKRYYEIFEKDVIKFGFSTREYVVLHEQSHDEEDDDDVIEDEEEVRVKDEPKD